MNELPKSETKGMTEFDLSNNENPRRHFKAYYGNQNVPHPTNSAAKMVDPSKVMRQVNEGK